MAGDIDEDLPGLTQVKALREALEGISGQAERLRELSRLEGAMERLVEERSRLLFGDVPEVLAAVDEESAARLRDLLGLEEIRPRRGDAFRPSEHNMLRAVPDGGEGLEDRIAECHAAGLRLRESGRVVRQAEVSVFV